MDPQYMGEQMNAVSAGTLLERMDITIVEASIDRVVARMPVAGNTQPYGLLHGGASAVLAESVGSIGSAMHGAVIGRLPVGIELSCSHHRAVRDGSVTATATPISLGRTLATWEIVVTDDAGRRVCTARLTCAMRQAPPADGDSGENADSAQAGNDRVANG